ncbi:hypothetical protein SAMN04488065_0630 [Haloplanus vescus]|uniref:Uncharacterized protein n=1 Tax=Haloplanus vescus TaxID=555874 RepID=A0A1H3W895_9EURY|nr:hypothetical protein [Haloplanus vescus]SDZ83061.1 hypothetical protein SAMN04488065_0630 [Haloplanus vescus]
MAKVSIGLRGWRFEESEVFTEDGEFKPLDEIPEEPRERLVRLTYLVEEPCDACYLEHGDEHIERCAPAAIVYGEPGDELLLCDDHEADFLYWYREAGGKAHRGDPDFREQFHDWFANGGRAPDAYGGLDHVETDPDTLPAPPGPEEVHQRVNESFEGRTIDLRDDRDEETGDDEDLDLDDVDLGTDYPSR